MKQKLFLILLSFALFLNNKLEAQIEPQFLIHNDLNTQTGYYCDGQYSQSTDYTFYLKELNLQNFTISVQFNATESRRHWVFVMGNSYRWLGFLINANNQITLTANNQSINQLTEGIITPEKWYTATISYGNGTAKIYLDDREISSFDIVFDVPAGGDNNISTTNYSNGTAFKGSIRNLNVWNTTLSAERVSELALNISVAATPPVINFQKPNISYIETKESRYNLTVCIESTETLKNFQLLINGYASRGFKLAQTAGCSQTIDQIIELNEGKNTIKVIAENSGGVTESNTYIIEYVNKKEDISPPEIKIISPIVTRGAIVFEETATIEVKGIATDPSGIALVKINEIETNFDEIGYFTQSIELAEGENTFIVVAIDKIGNKSSSAFTIQRKGNKPPNTTITENTLSTSGNYYALIIGVEEYLDPNISDLDKPVQDAEKLYNTLTSKYTFAPQNVKFLKNPGSDDITAALEEYYTKLTKEDNLLIFYAGHGYWDEKFDQGYWLAGDAERSNRGTWISNSTIRDYMKAIPTKHTLLITDACFGGGIFKSRNAFANATVAINQLYKYPSRKAMTSGALSEVPDQSVFIQFLVTRLEENTEKYISSEELFNSFKVAVINNSANGQIPQYGEVKQTGYEGGEFIFIKK